MIQLLFLVLFAEGAVAFLLLVKVGPLRELVMRSLDQVKMGKGPPTIKTIACTMFVIFLSSVASILKIHNKGTKLGIMTPMEQVLYRSNLLEASLIGFSLFLGFIVDRMHHYLRKLVRLKAASRDLKKDVQKLQDERTQLKSRDVSSSNRVESLEKELSAEKEHVKKLKRDGEEKNKKIETAEAHVESLQKQTENFLLEYDKLLEENQVLQAQFGGNKN